MVQERAVFRRNAVDVLDHQDFNLLAGFFQFQSECLQLIPWARQWVRAA
jgi:hypothetical protein